MAKQLQDPKAASQPLSALFRKHQFMTFNGAVVAPVPPAAPEGAPAPEGAAKPEAAPKVLDKTNLLGYFGEPSADPEKMVFGPQRVRLECADGTVKTIYDVSLADGKQVYASDFTPAKGSNLRALNLETAGELVSSVLLADPEWKGSRFQALRGWAQLYPVFKQLDPLDGTGKVGDDKKFMGPYVKWLSRALVLDAKDPKHNPGLDGFDPVREQMQILKGLVGVWRERGYRGGDGLHLKEANANLRSLYALFQDKEPVYGPKFDRSGVTNPLSGYDEAIKHETIQYASTPYQSDEDFYRAFLALNAGFIRADLFAARRDLSVPTTYPGLKLDLPSNLLPSFGEWPQGAERPRVAYRDSNRQQGENAIYVFDKFDGDKPLGQARVDAEAFQAVRRQCHPTLDLGEGTEARYLHCKRSNPNEPTYHYMVVKGIGSMQPGRMVVLDEEAQVETIKRNQDRTVDGHKVTSTNTRGNINDHFENFFSDAMPTPLKNSAPDAEGMQRIKEYVMTKVNDAYIPAWADIADPTATPDLVTREAKIAKFLTELLAPLRSTEEVLTDLDRVRLARHQRDNMAVLTEKVGERLNHRIFNLYHEGKFGPPDRMYPTYRNESDKFNRWRKDLTSPTDTPEQADAKIAAAWKEAMDHTVKQGFGKVIPRHFGPATSDDRVKYGTDVMRYVDRNACEILTQLASYSHGRKLEPVNRLEDLAKLLDPKIVELVFNHTSEQFLTHYSLSQDKLPYLQPKYKLEYSDRRAALRTNVTVEDYLARDAFAALSAQQKAGVVKSVAEKGQTLDDAERKVLQHLSVAKCLKETNADNDYEERILKALTQRAGREMPSSLAEVRMTQDETKRLNAALLGDLSARSAQKILDAHGQGQEMSVAVA